MNIACSLELEFKFYTQVSGDLLALKVYDRAKFQLQPHQILAQFL